MNEQRSKPDLASIEPLAPPADAGQPADAPVDQVDRVGRAAAEVLGSTPAVGVTAETLSDEDDEDPAAGSPPAIEAPERD